MNQIVHTANSGNALDDCFKVRERARSAKQQALERTWHACDLIVLQDCQEGYESSIREFEVSGSNLLAHYIIREDSEATQMVDLADWHARTSIDA